MRFAADFHIHSHYSRATSKNCDLEHLWAWAQVKGLRVVGTGDFTHPGWLDQIRTRLEPAEPGLFRLKDEFAAEVAGEVSESCRGDVRFVLTAEISNIYKRDGATRKVHNLLFAPDLETAARIGAALDKIGNITSDGRPILGLDSRDLLEIALEAGPDTFLIPAHIWTPWFSVLGSKSGFDSIEACYGDLTDHIFALETGLSSDPSMNWRLSGLDRYTLVSNSDAHSPSKLGREANLFDCEPDYFAMRQAMKTRKGFLGTVEFFPEEGKYHFDGHRKCKTRMAPRETIEQDGLCPVCGKGVTVGVMSRVEQLADRAEAKKPKRARPFHSLVGLDVAMGQVVGQGPNTKKVRQLCHRLLERIGPEFTILMDADTKILAAAGGPLVAEAVSRIRKGRLEIQAGYDGEFGKVCIFAKGEREKIVGQTGMVSVPASPKRTRPAPLLELAQPDRGPAPAPAEPPVASTQGPNPEQARAIDHTDGPLLIAAGPGTGKTRTLTLRAVNLIQNSGVPPGQILAVTFTNRAADEMRDRIEERLGARYEQPTVATFHALCLKILREHATRVDRPVDFSILDETDRRRIIEKVCDLGRSRARELLERISFFKQGTDTPDDVDDAQLADAWRSYDKHLAATGALDLDDLVRLTIRLCQDHPEVRRQLTERWRYLMVDEYQDVNTAQYRLLRLLAPGRANLCVIGDPDQAIYGFRGADHTYFLRFQNDYPTTRVVELTRNYRSGPTILDGAYQVVEKNAGRTTFKARSETGADEQIRLVDLPTEKAEAEFIAHEIERLIGGVSHFSMDSDRTDGQDEPKIRSFSDVAVLFRINALAAPVQKALDRLGIPCQAGGAAPFFQLPDVRRVMACMRALAFRPSREHLAPALARSIEALRPEVQGLRPIEVVERILKLPEIKGKSESNTNELRRDRFERLEHRARIFQGTLETFCDNAALHSPADDWDPRAERVSLLSLHASKGLEFKVVFIIGCEAGMIPYQRKGLRETPLEEERRLFFVGMTRARERLYLIRTLSRFLMGERRQPHRSPFLNDIEHALTARVASDMRGAGKRLDNSKQLKLF